MTLIKVILTVSFLALFVWAMRNRNRAELRASFRVGLVIFVALAITAVLRPELTIAAAQFVGVKRGTDLLVYALTVGFLIATIVNYLRVRELEQRLAKVVRAMAIHNAPERPAAVDDAE